MSTPSVLAVIPARYGSTRFPGKPLALIKGKPMILHVWERVRQVADVDQVIVATDDPRIQDVVTEAGGMAVLTPADCPSGSDRVWAVASQYPEYDWILNVQGDEPFLDPADCSQLLQAVKNHSQWDVGTLVCPIDVEDSADKAARWLNPNVVKAVLATDGRVLYFSRSPIPYQRDPHSAETGCYHHLGLYLYQRRALEQFTQLPQSPLERLEKLEQLRALEAGMTIVATVVDSPTRGVDTPEDLAQLNL